MSPVTHAAASSIVSLLFAYFSSSFWGTAACFLSGIFIDIDHVFDFWIAKRKISFNYSKLYRFCGEEKGGRLVLLFHSYELLAVLWIFILNGTLGIVWLGIAVGVTVHLLMDQIGNPLSRGALFFYKRWSWRFSKQGIFPEDYFQKLKDQ